MARKKKASKPTAEERKAARQEARRQARTERRLRNRAAHDAGVRAASQELNSRKIRFEPFESFETDASRDIISGSYSLALAEWVCATIAINVASTLRICANVPGFPKLQVLQRWRAQFAEFDRMYDQAKSIQADLMADETIDIADTPQEGVTTTEKPEGIEYKREDMLGHRKLQCDTRKWFAARLNPKYSDKLTLDGGLSNTNLNADVDSLDDASLEAIARAGKPALTKSTKVTK